MEGGLNPSGQIRGGGQKKPRGLSTKRCAQHDRREGTRSQGGTNDTQKHVGEGKEMVRSGERWRDKQRKSSIPEEDQPHL